MLNDIVLNYKNKQEIILKDIEFNKKIEEFISYIQETEFLKLNVKELISFLEENNYSFYPLKNLETTLLYIQLNNSFLDTNCQKFLKDFISSLNSLKKNTSLNESISLSRINFLIDSLNDSNSFIEDLDLIIIILKELNISQEDIFTCIKEIHDHNQNLFHKKQLEGKDIEETKEKIEDKKDNQQENNISSTSLSNLDIIKDFGYLISFNEDEKKMLEKVSKQELEDKLTYLKNNLDYNFLKDNKYQKLLVVILAFANLEDIESIYNICKKYNLSLKDVLPTTYLKTTFIPLSEVEDEFYKNLIGTYEYFSKNILLLEELNINITKEFRENPTFFITRSDLISHNLKVFKAYDISITSNDESFLNALMVEDLIFKLDSFIEANLFDYVKEYKSLLLNKDKAFFPRIYFAKMNNLPIKRRYLNKEITSLDGYNITTDNYLEMIKPYQLPYLTSQFSSSSQIEIDNYDEALNSKLIQLLESNYLLDSNAYYIANTYISRYKVLRIYQSLLNSKNINHFEAILFSILDKTILSKEKYEDIVIEVLNFYLVNKVIYFDVAVSIATKLGVENEKIISSFGNIEKRGGK